MSETRYPEILQDLKDNVTASMISEGIDSALATKVAHVAAERIRKTWGGMLTYIPKGQEYELSHRDLEIWGKFSGRNHHQLCAEYDVSLQWLYKIIAYQRKKEMRDRQEDLFE